MGCSCKNKANLLDTKYGDGNNEKNETFLLKILNFILQIAFGILCGAIIIVMGVFVLFYVVGCIIIGRQPSFKIKNIEKFKNYSKFLK